jgi:hypothetical protein
LLVRTTTCHEGTQTSIVNNSLATAALHIAFCLYVCVLLFAVLSWQVVERVVEVEPDKAALVEQLRAQMKAEMEAQQEQQLQGQALEAARQEAEARARQQLEVGSIQCAGLRQLPCCRVGRRRS